MTRTHVLALDEGTSSCRSIVFDAEGAIRGVSQSEFTQHFPKPGWVKHDPEEIWRKQLSTVQEAFKSAGVGQSEMLPTSARPSTSCSTTTS